MRIISAIVGAALAATGMATIPAIAADESITARVTTTDPTVGQQLTIDGDVANAPMYPVTVAATRTDSTGTTPMPVDSQSTDSNGHFTLHDTPPARGTVTYHLSVGDASAAATDVQAHVAGKTTNLTITAKPLTADANTTVHVTAHLGSPTSDRTVTLSAQPYQGSRHQFDSGPVDANGNREAGHAVQRRTTFIASFAGDPAYAPASAVVTVRVRAVINAQLRGGYATRHGYRLYHRNADVNVFIHMKPEYKGACIVMRAQRKSHGTWHSAAVSGCGSDAIRTNSSGEVIAQLQPPHVLGVPYRLRAEFRGTTALAGRHGAWLHLRFQN